MGNIILLHFNGYILVHIVSFDSCLGSNQLSLKIFQYATLTGHCTRDLLACRVGTVKGAEYIPTSPFSFTAATDME